MDTAGEAVTNEFKKLKKNHFFTHHFLFFPEEGEPKICSLVGFQIKRV